MVFSASLDAAYLVGKEIYILSICHIYYYNMMLINVQQILQTILPEVILGCVWSSHTKHEAHEAKLKFYLSQNLCLFRLSQLYLIFSFADLNQIVNFEKNQVMWHKQLFHLQTESCSWLFFQRKLNFIDAERAGFLHTDMKVLWLRADNFFIWLTRHIWKRLNTRKWKAAYVI